MSEKASNAIKGKRVLITGGTKRLGGACARDLVSKGAHVIIHCNTSWEQAVQMAKELGEDFASAGGKAYAIKADLAKPEEAETLVEKAVMLAGPLDILINNASIYPECTILDMTIEDLFSNITVNAFSPLVLSRCFAQRFMEKTGHAKSEQRGPQQHRGVIINFLDSRICEYDRLHAAYHTSKRMLADFTRMCALEFAPGVRVCGVAPGLILPPEGKDDGYFRQFYNRIPLSSHGSVEDITSAVRFLIESSFITGQILYADGGAFMKGNTYGF
ncbi:MAG: SDR family NAD(P)-dependent oxidoreductase [Spirochaetaceae bacterium]|nr:MAG: SDR family NAD(P)-dependent oxidoreductase [Spirochaetaceae bacterium]